MKYKQPVFCIATILLLFYCCSKSRLDKPPLGLLDETSLADKSGVEGLLIGAYALLDGVSGDQQGSVGMWSSAGSNWIYGSICGGEAYPGSKPDDGANALIIPIEKFDAIPTNDYLNDKWKVVYAGVQRANAVLRVMRKATDIQPSDTVEIKAEALFLRAFYHFEAKKMWGSIPFIDETITYDAGNYYVANDTSWTKVENDFAFAADNLPETQNNGPGRANKYAAIAFLAKVYMFEHRFSDAKPLLEKLISSGVTASGKPYALENFADNFNPQYKNGSESVFAVQNSVNDGAFAGNGNLGDALNFPQTNAVAGGCCGFFQPSFWLVNHFKTDATTGLPDLDGFNDTNMKNDQGYGSDSLFEPYNGTLDPRLDVTLGRRGLPYLDWGPDPGQSWVRDQVFAGPYLPKKNAYYKSQVGHFSDASWGSSTANNINLIRYSDILLWAAEVEAEIGSPDQARIYVNQVRLRAKDSTGWIRNDDNIPYAKAVTQSQAEFDVINDPAYSGIQIYDWVVRKDLNQTWMLIKVNPDGTKFWNPYSAPNYKVELYPPTWSDRESALKAIRYERILELAMEGHRFFDLVRWGTADQELNTYLQKEMTYLSFLNGAKFTKGVNERFPIPQNQIDLSVNPNGIRMLTQNPGY